MVPGAAWILTALGAAAISSADAAEALQNVYGRAGTTLNGEWRVIVDPYENGYYNYRREPFDAAAEPSGGYFLDRKPADRSELVEYDFDASPKLVVPGDWNSQDDRLYYYEGTVWYRRKFDYAPTAGRRVFVHFGAANYQADVYLNGRKLGRHVGGFTPFQFEITGMLAARGNSLVVKVDNTRRVEGIPTVNTDWWNYGGLTRDVTIVETPATYIRDYAVQLAAGSSDRIVASVELDGAKAAGVGVTLSIPEAGIRVRALSDARGIATFDVAARALEEVVAAQCASLRCRARDRRRSDQGAHWLSQHRSARRGHPAQRRAGISARNLAARGESAARRARAFRAGRTAAAWLGEGARLQLRAARALSAQ